MRLPDIELDDRRFQDLVYEARRRIARSCPEWTEHNVSDPGITLIELFAWMTEMTIYRLNRVPDKLHVQLLELLGIRLDGPSAARTEIRFRLAGAATEPVPIRSEHTEVGTLRTATEDAVVFRVDADFTIPAARPVAYVLQRGVDYRDVGVADGTALPQGEEQHAFGSPPEVDDALYLGFDQPLARLLLAVDMQASQARGTGVHPEDPPLRWEVAQADGGWAECDVLRDLTGGFNYGSGTVELQLPRESAPTPVGGRRLHWLRCRIDARSRSGRAASYTQPPEIYSITAAPIGALLEATHAAELRDELLGTSDGTPGQVLSLRFSPVLPLRRDETLEVREPGSASWVPWELRESFADSSDRDHHFALDLVSGQVELGPAIREADGRWSQYGAVPPKGSLLRMSRYRHGGGRAGNVAEHTLTQLRTPIPGMDTVTNPRPATGGVDPERLDSARERAALTLRSRFRAVTAEDFEILAGEASPNVARAVCVAPVDGGPVTVRIVPRVEPADRRLSYEQLLPSDELLQTVAEYLDERRLIGTTVRLLPARFRGLTVVCAVEASPLAHAPRVEADVGHALYSYLNPLVGGDVHGLGTGWPFGRWLNQGELYGVVHGVEGVEFVKMLRIYETDLRTGEQAAQPAGSHVMLEPDELVASGRHMVRVSQDGNGAGAAG